MEYHLQSGSHTVYALQYHFVTVTKYRADILTDERLERVAEVAHEIAEDFEADIKNVDGGTDHVHILFTEESRRMPRGLTPWRKPTLDGTNHVTVIGRPPNV